MTAPMSQEAPWPGVLEQIVDELAYRDGWHFELVHIDRGQGSIGLTLIVTIRCEDSYHPGSMIRVAHYMPVPPAAFDGRAWLRWLLDQVLLIEQHEACEFFRVGDERPFAPNHGPGRNPYSILERGTDLDAATSFTGQVNE